ncbi:hypothetical protein LWI29_028618 [Acer saccharum]|uniref:Endoglucanase n=1 Tax=Acer saccharum TaxID=4024 RepID=A0AA39W0N4_ACESA|nr:hypothetical protein LWI29_028618 [Acer saccharum]
MGGKYKIVLVLLGFVGMMMMMVRSVASSSISHDYGDALSKCILFFEGQRSGKLPSSQRMTWRKDSALRDGSDIGIDLVGGYYDAGDNIKFNFPMAFTTTVLAWSILEFGNHMGSEFQHATEAVKWGTDYFLKATSVPGKVVAQVGEPYGDHNCWERPEDMDTARTSYVVNTTSPGSEVSAEIAAALAASSMVFKNIDNQYSQVLLERASQVFQFADQHRGSYNESIGPAVCPFYCDFSGFMDDLIWGAAWLYKATNTEYYLKYVLENIHYLENVPQSNDPIYVGGSFEEFGWDSKHAGINVLLSGVDYLLGSNPIKMSYMVGYGRNFPRKIHHRGSTCPSIDKRRRQIKCHDGDVFFYSKYPNFNQLTGAIVGGPDINDQYNDTRIDFAHSEPTTYINAPFVGVLAFFKEKGR